MGHLNFAVALTCLVQIGAGLEVAPAGNLPTPRMNSAAIYDGHSSILLSGGGHDILKYNLQGDTVESVGKFPHVLNNGGLGTDGNGTFFHLGGQASLDYSNYIYQFSSKNPEPLRIGKLPRVNEYSGEAVSDGRGSIYLFATTEFNKPRELQRYDVKTNKVEGLILLPNNLSDFVFAMVGNSIYIFGGRIYLGGFAHYKFNRQLFKYTVSNNTIEVLDEVLEDGVYLAQAVAVGSDIYIVGGSNESKPPFKIRKFNTLTETMEEINVSNNPKSIYAHSLAYVPETNRIYIFGGKIDGKISSQISYIQL